MNDTEKTSSRTDTWPLIVIRHTTGVNNLPDIFGQLADCHRRHPGACDEFWFATGSRKTIPALEKECETFARYRPVCNEIGVIPSYQQGLTLGHGVAHDGPPKPDSQAFPEDAWQVGRDGRRLGFLCPRSPFVLDYEFNYAKTVLRVADPGSYWIDDDLRLGVHKPEGCFCDRCIAAFNAKTGGTWTRETLVERLFSDAPREPLRAAWIDFNAESLAVYAAKVREAADALGSPCRLAYQAVWADTIYTASSYRPLLEALSGPVHRPVGIRPGAGFYTEAEPRGMVSKCLSVAREAERCRRYGDLVASVCYEQETYPRHVLHKSPGAIMTESALALASGCDSLSLYWYAGAAPEGRYSLSAYWQDAKEGVRYLWGEKGLMCVTLYFIFSYFAGGASGVITLPYFKSAFENGEWLYMTTWGFSVAGRAIGGMLQYKIKYPGRIKYAVALAVYCIINVLEGGYLFLPVNLMRIACFLIGILGVTSYTIRSSATQSYVPDDKKGRFNGAFIMLTTSGSLLGELIAGACTSFLPMRAVLAGIMGIALIAAVTVIGGGRKHVKPLYNRES